MIHRTYIDVHVLQTVPPSCVNRDDAGTPKQAMYGGARRARVSSQAWKRATRLAFQDRLQLPERQLGVRTRRIATLLAARLADRVGLDEPEATRLGIALKDVILTPSKASASKTRARAGKRRADETEDEAQEETPAVTGAADPNGSSTKNPSLSPALLFVGLSQLDAIVDLVADDARDLAALSYKDQAAALASVPVRAKLRNGHPVDVALFGRFVADISMLNVEASCQVAHAISTHAAEFEFDYYTAVDDAKDPLTEDAGAAMIGTVEYTSATLYRYATVGMHQLLDNLDGDPDAASAALAAFVEAFTYSMPGGHQNTFAHRTLPSLVSVVVRDDQPVNLVSAFEAPVRSHGEGITRKSARLLAAELDRARAAWGITPLLVASQYDVGQDGTELTRVLGEPRPFPEIVETVTGTVRSRMPELAVQ